MCYTLKGSWFWIRLSGVLKIRILLYIVVFCFKHIHITCTLTFVHRLKPVSGKSVERDCFLKRNLLFLWNTTLWPCSMCLVQTKSSWQHCFAIELWPITILEIANRDLQMPRAVPDLDQSGSRCAKSFFVCVPLRIRVLLARLFVMECVLYSNNVVLTSSNNKHPSFIEN